jgi:hypothetical protein
LSLDPEHREFEAKKEFGAECLDRRNQRRNKALLTPASLSSRGGGGGGGGNWAQLQERVSRLEELLGVEARLQYMPLPPLMPPEGQPGKRFFPYRYRLRQAAAYRASTVVGTLRRLEEMLLALDWAVYDLAEVAYASSAATSVVSEASTFPVPRALTVRVWLGGDFKDDWSLAGSLDESSEDPFEMRRPPPEVVFPAEPERSAPRLD